MRCRKLRQEKIAAGSRHLKTLWAVLWIWIHWIRLSEIWSGMLIPDPDPESISWFFTHPGSRVRNTELWLPGRELHRWVQAAGRRASPSHPQHLKKKSKIQRCGFRMIYTGSGFYSTGTTATHFEVQIWQETSEVDPDPYPDPHSIKIRSGSASRW